MMDHPNDMRAPVRIHEERMPAFLESVVNHPAADIFISHDNLDTMFGTPHFYKHYCERTGNIQ
ncbi:MAG: hypothetical protein JSW26_10545 [Desulfobacterales bacterium]|nr:MAG: hypothetical protein JSW26_10545 [Desulfobacterales bacterium]